MPLGETVYPPNLNQPHVVPMVAPSISTATATGGGVPTNSSHEQNEPKNLYLFLM